VATPGTVTIVNTSDIGGGAERISMDLLNGFRSLGTEAWLAVASKRSEDPHVISFYTSPHVDYTPAHPIRRAHLRFRRRLDKRLGLEDFNHPYTRHLTELTGTSPDVVLCNNLHGGYFDLRMLPWLSRRVPVVLRLADSWALTGHCAVPGSCNRWRSGCGRCPDLETPPAISRDATRINLRRKRWIFARSRLLVAAPSQWMLERARGSILAPAIAGARVIWNGIDLATFNPEGPTTPRPNATTARLVFVANGGASNPHKDFPAVRTALRRLDRPVELVSVGGQERTENLGGGARIHHRARLSKDELAALYRSADAYVHAAPEESFSLTAAESLACGTPVVAASAGGIAEVVEDQRTGLLISPGDLDGLASALRRLLGDSGLRDRMRAAAASAGARFDGDRMVREWHSLCAEAMDELPAQWPARG
jgi:glycosyltransferase involved in cell wall biosynthesis